MLKYNFLNKAAAECNLSPETLVSKMQDILNSPNYSPFNPDNIKIALYEGCIEPDIELFSSAMRDMDFAEIGLLFYSAVMSYAFDIAEAETVRQTHIQYGIGNTTVQ